MKQSANDLVTMQTVDIKPRYQILGETTATPEMIDRLSQRTHELAPGEKIVEHRAQAKYEQQWRTLVDKYPPNPRQDKYLVWATSYSRQIGEDGTRGLCYVVGVYDKPKEALKVAKKITKKIGLSATAISTRDLIYLKPNIGQAITVAESDRDERLQRQEQEDCERVIEKYEKQMAIQEILDTDNRQLQDPDSLVYYRQAWYDRIVAELEMEQMRQQLDKKQQQAHKLEGELKQLYSHHPEYEGKIKQSFTDILTSLGEEKHLPMILQGHQALRSDVLGLAPSQTVPASSSSPSSSPSPTHKPTSESTKPRHHRHKSKSVKKSDRTMSESTK